jgi:hypothetical protein
MAAGENKGELALLGQVLEFVEREKRPARNRTGGAFSLVLGGSDILCRKG